MMARRLCSTNAGSPHLDTSRQRASRHHDTPPIEVRRGHSLEPGMNGIPVLQIGLVGWKCSALYHLAPVPCRTGRRRHYCITTTALRATAGEYNVNEG